MKPSRYRAPAALLLLAVLAGAGCRQAAAGSGAAGIASVEPSPAQDAAGDPEHEPEEAQRRGAAGGASRRSRTR